MLTTNGDSNANDTSRTSNASQIRVAKFSSDGDCVILLYYYSVAFFLLMSCMGSEAAVDHADRMENIAKLPRLPSGLLLQNRHCLKQKSNTAMGNRQNHNETTTSAPWKGGVAFWPRDCVLRGKHVNANQSFRKTRKGACEKTSCPRKKNKAPSRKRKAPLRKRTWFKLARAAAPSLRIVLDHLSSRKICQGGRRWHRRPPRADFTSGAENRHPK